MKNIFSIYLIFLVSSCTTNYSETIKIEDVSKDFSKKIEFELKENETVNRVIISIKGEINDTVMVNGRFLYPSNIDTVFRKDLYFPEFDFEYKSLNTTEGELKIRISFLII